MAGKLDWETVAKKAKSKKELEKLLREGPTGVSGVSEWDKRMEGRCPFCRKLLKEGESLDVHVYYKHSKDYKEKKRQVQKAIKKQGRLEIDPESITPMQAALLEAERQAAKKK